MMNRLISFLGLSVISLAALAAPKAELWDFWQASDESSRISLSHEAWSAFLERYLLTDRQPHKLRYGAVSDADAAALKRYLSALQAQDPRQLARAEQLPYWINLYNAATVDLILDHYPVKSITKIKSGLFSFGPWDRELLNIAGQTLSLNDVEHRILRPIFQDARLHYAVNCASIGCPNLAAVAYTADNTEALLVQGARAYVNDPRGVSIQRGKLRVSSIYDWFEADFGGSAASVITHLRKHADRELLGQLERFDKISSYAYDWSLNDHP